MEKKSIQGIVSIKFYALTIMMFASMLIENAAFGQEIANPTGLDLGDEYEHEMEGDYGTFKDYRWKVGGDYDVSIYAIDRWYPMGTYGLMITNDWLRLSAATGYVTAESNSGYGELYPGLNYVFRSCYDNTLVPLFGWRQTYYNKSHRYFVISN